jgi:mitochondrial-processing peptidase subunit beta
LRIAGRMVIVAAGGVKHDEVVANAAKTFSSLPADGTTASGLVAAEPSYFTGSAVNVRDPDMTTTGLAVAFKGASHLDPDSVTLSVMANILGSWGKVSGSDNNQRSRLATAVASNELADSVMGFSTPYHDTGLFGVYAQTSNPGEIEDLSWIIMNVRPGSLLASRRGATRAIGVSCLHASATAHMDVYF